MLTLSQLVLLNKSAVIHCSHLSPLLLQMLNVNHNELKCLKQKQASTQDDVWFHGLIA